MPKIIIACFVLPINVKLNSKTATYEFELTNGGLQTGLQGIKNSPNVLWLGWTGCCVDESAALTDSLRHDLLKNHNFVPVFLPNEPTLVHYFHYCFLSLYPTIHSLLERATFASSTWWNAYARINEQFAIECHELACNGDLVWLQHINLAMVPYFLSKLRSSNDKKKSYKIGFVHHNSFPPPDIFAYIPEARHLLDSLASADLVSFHVASHEINFRECCRANGIECSTAQTAVIPFGISLGRFEAYLASARALAKADELRARFKGKFVFLGCERADYIKAIDLKMKSFDGLLERCPELVGKCVLVQIAVPNTVPGRIFLKQTNEYAKELIDLSEDINR
jgi:trehalose-6-phosphate synthase